MPPRSRRARSVALLALLAVAPLAPAAPLLAQAGSAVAAAATPPPRTTAYSTSELRALGREILAERIAEAGRDTNPAWRRDVRMVIDSIRRASQYRAHDLAWEILADSSVNAAALPGGVMLVNVGLPIFCRDAGARKHPRDAAAARRAYIGCVAAVVGHEFGHLALGHSDSVGATVARRQDIARRRQETRTITAGTADAALMRGLRIERARELEADEAGALYLLRAGWEVQDAIDMFMELDALERGGRSSKQDLTWLRGHPRSSERMAALEMRRARLKLLQRDFDDALLLLEHAALPDSALALLDRVVADLPFIPAAHHARGVAFARKWLRSSSASELRVIPALPAYEARFIGAIRGDASALNAAREAFGRAVAIDRHAWTLANLAVLDAFAGDAARARERAAEAVRAAPDDPQVQNNAGVVDFRAGRYAAARAAFARAETLQGRELTDVVAFNVARATLAAGDTAAARPLLERYVRHDSTSGWGRAAVELQRSIGARTSGVAAGAASRAPVIAGLRLGTSPAMVRQTMGTPTSGMGDGRQGETWRYPSRGLTLFVQPERGLVTVALETREAGAVEAVRVGEPLGATLQRLGRPAHVQSCGCGKRMHTFVRQGWTLQVDTQPAPAGGEDVVTRVSASLSPG